MIKIIIFNSEKDAEKNNTFDENININIDFINEDSSKFDENIEIDLEDNLQNNLNNNFN